MTQAVFSVLGAIVVVIIGYFLVSSILTLSPEDYAVQSLRDISSSVDRVQSEGTTLLLDNCKDFRMVVPLLYRINYDSSERTLTLEKNTEKGVETIDRTPASGNFKALSSHDPDNLLNAERSGSDFSINSDFSEKVDEKICVCYRSPEGDTILFPRPSMLGIVRACLTEIA